ncbi:MAG: acyltransferase family protein [Desulfobulbales bacterium]
MYLHSFNYFRGIAILFIVTGHCLYMSGWAVDTVAEKLIANVVLGGTALFVFISGFLFHHIYYTRFDYRKFMATKIKNVLTPYFVLSTPLVLYSVLVKGTGPYAEFFFSREPGFFSSYIRLAALYLWTGRILEAYWYIPFIMVVFTFSPLVMAFIKLRPGLRIFILTILFTVSLLVQRPVLNISVLQSVVYFLPVYLFGIIVSIHRETIYTYLDGREIYLMITIVMLALVQSYYYPAFGNLHKPAFQLNLPDIILVQKIFLCLFFVVLLNRFEKTPIPLLDNLASASFAIYFIHPYVLWIVQMMLNRRYPLVEQIKGPVLWLIMTPAVVLISMIMAKGVRNIFKSHSRSIIGW